jgi:Rieske 2Fe-2S family protein
VNGELVPTLPRSAYVDEGEWQVERERIFARQWVLAGRESDVAAVGDFLRVDVAGESVIAVRRDDGELGAFYNVCRHRGAELVDTCGARSGSFGPLIRCPYHSWTYGLDGALRRTPFMEIPVMDDPLIDETVPIALHPVGVDTWGGFVFVHLTPARARPLLDQLGAMVDRVRRYPLAELRSGATFTYDVACNWKVIAENYNECYHCAPVHPELCDLVPAFRRGGAELGWVDGIPLREGAWTFTSSGTSERAPFEGLDAAERQRHKGELVYPNLLLSMSAEHVAAYNLQPRGPAATHVVCDLLFHPDEIARATFDPSDAGDLWDVVNRQDWRICESVQRGMTSRAWTGGWFAPMEDESADISRWYAASMVETTGSRVERDPAHAGGLDDGLDDG